MGMSRYSIPEHVQIPDVRPSELVEIVRSKIFEQRAIEAMATEAPSRDDRTLAEKVQLLFEESPDD